LRFNFTHFTPESASPIITMIRNLNTTLSEPFQLMMDIEGPSIRTREIPIPIPYKQGEKIRLVMDETTAQGKDMACDYAGIINDVKVGDIVRIESWLFDTIVNEKWSDYIVLEAQNDFTLTSKRHINLPGVHINQPTVTEKDRQDIHFAIEAGFSYIAISFCRSANDLRQVRDFVGTKYVSSANQQKPLLIAKVENQEALDRLDEITQASDIVMVARGDLGTEVPLETLPEIQMHIVKTCKLNDTPVIVATQMLSSMVENPAPTRAEVSDIFLAVREGADYLMLSEETTVGKYPVQAVEIMKKTIEEAQKSK
jgi:pyruvate kinase